MLRLFILLFCTANSFSQSYNSIDAKVKLYPEFKSIDHLSLRIRNDFTKDKNRIRAAFVWVTNNITYHKGLSTYFTPKQNIVYYSDYGKEYELNKYKNKQINTIFKQRRGVCVDYSSVLNYLLNSFGLEAEIIHGFGKIEIKNINKELYYKNHTWNAVKLNGVWKLMDPTWASGFINYNTKKFIKEFEEYYYFTSPLNLIKSHFPGNDYWQFLEQKVSLQDFFNSPIYYPGYFKNNIKLASDHSGTLVMSDQNYITLEFEKLNHLSDIYYQIGKADEKRKLKIEKSNLNYLSKIKFRKQLEEIVALSLYLKNEEVLKFRIRSTYD